MYYVNVRTTDSASNVSTPISSNGQLVAPTVSFSVSPASITFNRLKASNQYTDTQATTLTTSTNAYGGYVVRAYTTDLLRDSSNRTINMFGGGTYAAPAAWGANTGFGYTSSDVRVQSPGFDNNKFGASSCTATGASPTCLFAPFTQTKPGDIVADHDTGVTGSFAVSNEPFTITYRVVASATQAASTYNTSTIYTVSPIY